jgi:hypothetical protein
MLLLLLIESLNAACSLAEGVALSLALLHDDLVDEAEALQDLGAVPVVQRRLGRDVDHLARGSIVGAIEPPDAGDDHDALVTRMILPVSHGGELKLA